MTIGTEITLASVLQVLITVAGIIYAWADSRSRIVALEKRVAEQETSIRLHQEVFSMYRETQARQLVTREVLRDVETSIGQQLTYLRERMDDLHDRMLPPR